MDRKVLIIVENLPVPFDTRVWQEATTLAANGYTVSVICPTGKGYDKEYEFLQGVHIYRHKLPKDSNGALGYGFFPSRTARCSMRRNCRSRPVP